MERVWWAEGGGGGGVLFASNKRTESVYILLTEPSGYGLYGLFKNFFFFKMQFLPSRQQRAVESQIFIHHVTSAVIIYFWVSIDVKTFHKIITKLTINEQEQGRTKIKVGEFIGFGYVSDRGSKIFFGSNKKTESAY